MYASPLDVDLNSYMYSILRRTEGVHGVHSVHGVHGVHGVHSVQCYDLPCTYQTHRYKFSSVPNIYLCSQQ